MTTLASLTFLLCIGAITLTDAYWYRGRDTCAAGCIKTLECKAKDNAESVAALAENKQALDQGVAGLQEEVAALRAETERQKNLMVIMNQTIATLNQSLSAPTEPETPACAPAVCPDSDDCVLTGTEIVVDPTTGCDVCQCRDTMCDFEEDMCLFTQKANDWVRHSGSTPTPDTGPGEDHTLGTEFGHYIYLKSDVGTSASLVSPVVSGSQPMCLTFWYHMLGDEIYELYVNARNESTHNVWSEYYEVGDKWIQARETIPAGDAYKLMFGGWSVGPIGDMAFDDINLQKGACN